MQEGVCVIPQFTFECGAALDHMRVGYTTHGSCNSRRDNAILVTHGTSANRHTFDPYIGPGRAFDTERYYVVAVDAIGGGASSSPRDGLGVDFPRHTIRDMVRAQHHLVSHELNLPGLLATGGYSMGAFQALCRDPLGDGTHGAEPGRRGVEGASLCRGKDSRVSFAVVAYVRSLQSGPPRP